MRLHVATVIAVSHKEDRMRILMKAVIPVESG